MSYLIKVFKKKCSIMALKMEKIYFQIKQTIEFMIVVKNKTS